MVLAQSCVFSKQSLDPFHCDPLRLREQVSSPYMGHSLSLSYGVILPSSLTKVLSSALGYSPHLPVSVLVRSLLKIRTEVFLGSPFSHFRLINGPAPTPRLTTADLPTVHLQARDGDNQRSDDLPNSVTPSSTLQKWCTNINALSIDYAFRPRLRCRLTLGGFAFPRKP